MNYLNELQYALRFTEIYKENSDKPKEIREAMCLDCQIDHVLQPIANDDLVVGYMVHGFVGFSSQYGGIYTYFFHKDRVEEALSIVKNSVDNEFIQKAEEMISFWETEATTKKLEKSFKDKYGFILPKGYSEPGLANAGQRVAGNQVDLDKLIKLGISGLREEIKSYYVKSPNSFYEALLMSVDLIVKACDLYIKNAEELLETEIDENRRIELIEISNILRNIKEKKPNTFKEGVQLFWIYSVISDLMNYGRMDVYLGDLYCKDIDRNIITEEEAIQYLSSLWRQFVRIGKVHDCRVIVGGIGRRNEKNADILALVIMEVSRRIKEVVPQLTLRYYTGMDQKLFDKALAVVGEGYCFPMIYSDDTNVPAVMKAYNVSRDEAERYLPFGCGEYVMEGLSTGTPNNGINLLKALELVLHNGYDRYWNMQLEESYGELNEIDSFEKLFEIYKKYVNRNVYLLADYKKMNYDVAGEQAAFLHLSLLTDDCIKRGKSLLNGGVRYLNASSEVFGMISCADSMSAIKKLVFDEKRFTLQQVVDMLDKNFEGFEMERKLFLNAPKYGNDDSFADCIVQIVYNHIADETIKAGEKVGLNKYLMVSVNNSMSAEWGTYCLASGCGRKKGDPMANANGASIGADRNGLTSLLNSMAKFDNTKHVGVINNIRFTKEMYQNSLVKLKTLLISFFKNNGVQLNLTCIGKDDLKKAQINPDGYKNLIVRIGGFSARFVELNPVVQNEIIRRTTYEG